MGRGRHAPCPCLIDKVSRKAVAVPTGAVVLHGCLYPSCHSYDQLISHDTWQMQHGLGALVSGCPF